MINENLRQILSIEVIIIGFIMQATKIIGIANISTIFLYLLVVTVILS